MLYIYKLYIFIVAMDHQTNVRIDIYFIEIEKTYLGVYVECEQVHSSTLYFLSLVHRFFGEGHLVPHFHSFLL